MSRQAAIALVLLSALGFGTMALFAKVAYAGGMTPTVLLALRFLLAVALLAPVVWAKRMRLPRGRVLAGFALMGLLYTAQSQSYFTALLHASSGLVGLLLYVYPVLVTLFALAFGWEKPERRTFVLLAVAVAGIAITLGGNLQGSPLGIALGLLAAVVYAVYILIGGRVTRDIQPLAGTLVVMATAALANGALAIAGGQSLPTGVSTWLAVGAIALFSTVIAVGALLAGIRHIGPAQASIISTLEPVITLCLGALLLGENVSAGQVVGGVMVLSAVIMLARRP
ncbi:MAG TPA: DMT family transporter [Noviherbaspirillum sp.]|jgi:drug/metabolite transporter (DMT)-like permease|uniref:DMT family transporter n=1 Tax=Noviherbaspirillum sp. TaxID=1926288 RepID=UPI002DDD8989|nr:DMT family transporter [Noviherbaspirillum sp.]HEV2611593.1 DMT family transporter [Noviherbaspirillum sp.]